MLHQTLQVSPKRRLPFTRSDGQEPSLLSLFSVSVLCSLFSLPSDHELNPVTYKRKLFFGFHSIGRAKARHSPFQFLFRRAGAAGRAGGSGRQGGWLLLQVPFSSCILRRRDSSPDVACPRPFFSTHVSLGGGVKVVDFRRRAAQLTRAASSGCAGDTAACGEAQSSDSPPLQRRRFRCC
jgi:hypothetical protein